MSKVLSNFISQITLFAIIIVFFLAVKFLYGNNLIFNNDFFHNPSSYIELSLKLLILGPLVEEFLFRYGLLFSPTKASILIISLIFPTVIFFLKFYFSFMVIVPYLIIFFVLLFLILKKIVRNNEKYFKIIYKKHFMLLICLSGVMFSFSHFDYNSFLISPVLILKNLLVFFCLSLILGISRIKKGFAFAFTGHSFYNFLTIIL